MGRWPADARVRLESAALELFAEQGFAETTVPQITARAGLTTRTYFRHFADKREVLFAYDADIPGFVEPLLADAPAESSPMEVLDYGLRAIAAKFEGLRDYLVTRRHIVETDESLRERELRKHAVLSGAIRRGFLDRGCDDLTSTLAGHLGMTVFSVALARWLDHADGPSFWETLRETMAATRALMTDGPSVSPSDGEG